MSEIRRADHRVESERGIHIYIREVERAHPDERRVPVILLHGARAGGIASFDLDVPGGSLAADLAAAGHPVFVMDARGYGSSSRPPQMSQPPDANPALVRTPEVARDIAAVVEWACHQRGSEQVGLFGWATGGHWIGYYATLHPERVSHLILHNTLYGATPEHPGLGRGSDLEDPVLAGRYNQAAFGAWRSSTAESLLRTWNNSIPVENLDEWRDPEVAEAFAAAALASDPGSASRTPPAFSHPSGAMEDSFYLAIGRQLWDASLIYARTLIIRSGRDFWSRPEDVERLVEHLAHAADVRAVTLPDATHHVHLDRAERGRARLIDEVLGLLRT